MYAHDAGSACSLVLLQVATPRSAPLLPLPSSSSSAPCVAGAGNCAHSPANEAPVTLTASQQQLPRAGSNSAEATSTPSSSLEHKVKPVTIETESRVRNISNVTDSMIGSTATSLRSCGSGGGGAIADPMAGPGLPYDPLDGTKAGQGDNGAARSTLRTGSDVPLKHQGSPVLTRPPLASNSNGGVKNFSYAQALKSLRVSPEQATSSKASSRSHTPSESSITHNVKDRSHGSSRSSTPHLNKPATAPEHKEGVRAMLHTSSESTSRSQSALSNVADLSSESTRSDSAQTSGRVSVEGHPPTPDLGKSKVAMIGSPRGQPSPNPQLEKSCGTKLPVPAGSFEGRLEVAHGAGRSAGSSSPATREIQPTVISNLPKETPVPVAGQEAQSYPPGLHTEKVPSAEPTPASANVPSGATKVQSKPAPPPGLTRPNSQQIHLGPQLPAAAQLVTVFPQAVSEATPSDSMQPQSKLDTEVELGRFPGRVSTSLADPQQSSTSDTEVQRPMQGINTSFPSTEFQAFNTFQKHTMQQNEALRFHRLQIQQSLLQFNQPRGPYVSPHSVSCPQPHNQRPPMPQQQLGKSDKVSPPDMAIKPIGSSQEPSSSEGQSCPTDSQGPAAPVNIVHSPHPIKPSPASMLAPLPPPGLIRSFPTTLPGGGPKNSSPSVQAHPTSAFSPYSQAHPVVIQPAHTPPGHQQPPLFASNFVKPVVPVGNLAVADQQRSTPGHGVVQSSPQNLLDGNGRELQSSESNKPPSSLSITALPFVPSYGGSQTPVSHSTPTSSIEMPYSAPEFITPSFVTPMPPHVRKSVSNLTHRGSSNGLHIAPRQPPGFERPPVLPAMPPPHFTPRLVLDPVQVQMFQRVQAAAAAQVQAMANLGHSPALVNHPPTASQIALMRTLQQQLAVSPQQLQHHPHHHHPLPTHLPPSNPPAVQRKPSLQQVLASQAILQQLHAETTPPGAVQVITPQAIDQMMMQQQQLRKHIQKSSSLPFKDGHMRKPAHPYVAEHPSILNAMAPTSEMQARTLLPNAHASVPNPSLAAYNMRPVGTLDFPAGPTVTSHALLMQPKVTMVTSSVAKRAPLLPTPPIPSFVSSNSPFSLRLPTPHVQVSFPTTQDQHRPSSLYPYNPTGQY